MLLRTFLLALIVLWLTPNASPQSPAPDSDAAALPDSQSPAPGAAATPPALEPLIPSAPLLGPVTGAGISATPRVTLPPDTVSHLDTEYDSAIAAQIPVEPRSGRPLSLIEAVRLTLNGNTQIRLSDQDVKIARAFLQQNTGAFDSHLQASGSKDRDSNEKTPAQVRMDLQNQMTKTQLARQFLGEAALLTADLKHSMATGTAPQQNFTEGGNSSVSSDNGVLSNNTVEFLNTSQQNLANAQQDTQTAFSNLMTQIAENNATPAQIAQLKGLQTQNITEQQQLEQTFITAFQKVGGDLQKSVETLPTVTNISNTTDYSVGATKLFRNGVTIQPLLSYTQQGNGSGLPNNQGRIGFTLNVPLLRGYGEAVADAPERAASIDHEAAQLVLRHTVAMNVYQTALLYWTVVASQHNVDLLKQSHQVATTLLNLSNQLVKADELAPADVFVIAARVSDTQIQVYSAELGLLDAQQQLAVQIGEDAAKLTVPLVATDDFPAAKSSASIHDVARDPLVQTAAGLRADLLASRKSEISGRVLVRAARLNLKPQLNFSLNTSFSAIDDGSHANKYFDVFTTSYTGPSVMGAFVFDWPVANNLQRGLLNQSLATLQQRAINTEDLLRNITSSVVFSVGSVENALQQYEASSAGRLQYRKSLDAEYAKLKAGNSTFLNAVETEELFTSAGLSEITAELQYASSLARVRYETGTILPPTPDAIVDWADLTTIPSPVGPTSYPVRPAVLRREIGMNAATH